MAQDLKSLEDNQAFRSLIIDGFLGEEYAKAKEELLKAIQNGDKETEEQKRIYVCERYALENYLESVRRGSKAEKYIELDDLLALGELSQDEVFEQLRRMNSE